MKIFLQLIIFFLVIVKVNAEEFQLGTTEIREKYTFIQLQYGQRKGESFSDIFKRIHIEKDSVAIRILGIFSKKTNSELLSYYKDKMPNEFNKAFSSSGNLHNPSLAPLISDFKNAFKTTSLFQEIEAELKKIGFMITEIKFEKYTFTTYREPRFSVVDIWLKFSKSPNNAFNLTPQTRAFFAKCAKNAPVCSAG